MKRLLFLELKLLWPSFAIIYGILTLLTVLMKVPVLLTIMPMGSVYIFGLILRRSPWYLNLPCSRSFLILFVMCQNLIFFIVSLLTSYLLIFLLKDSVDLSGGILFYYKLTFYLGLFGSIFASSWVLTGKPMKRMQLKKVYPSKKNGIVGLIVVIVFLSIWKFRLFSEPLVVWSVLIDVPFCLCFAFCYQIVLPFNNLRKLNAIAWSSIACLILLPLVSAIIFAHFGKPGWTKYNWEVSSLDVLGRLPIFISGERAFELFVQTNAGASPSLERNIEFIKTHTDFNTWEKRTGKCYYKDCFNLSSDATDFDKIDNDEAGKRFLSLMKNCKFVLGGEGVIKCSDGHVSGDRLNAWIAFLDKKDILKKWLSSKDSREQIIALKGLVFNADESEDVQMKNLSSSADPIVATTARKVIMKREAFKAMKLDCKLVASQEKQPCQERKKGPQIEF